MMSTTLPARRKASTEHTTIRMVVTGAAAGANGVGVVSSAVVSGAVVMVVGRVVVEVTIGHWLGVEGAEPMKSACSFYTKC